MCAHAGGERCWVDPSRWIQPTASLDSPCTQKKPFVILRRGDFYIASAHLTTLGLYKALLSGVFMVFSTVFFNEAVSLMSPIIDYGESLRISFHVPPCPSCISFSTQPPLLSRPCSSFSPQAGQPSQGTSAEGCTVSLERRTALLRPRSRSFHDVPGHSAVANKIQQSRLPARIFFQNHIKAHLALS